MEKRSALLDISHEEQVPVDADHSAMCKFETDKDDTFEKVYKRIKRMKNNPQRVTNEPSGMYVSVKSTDRENQFRLNDILVSYNTHFEVSHLLSPVFTGRDEELQCLTISFAKGPSSEKRHQRRFVLFGLGGSGKTQICLKYVQDQRERYMKFSD